MNSISISNKLNIVVVSNIILEPWLKPLIKKKFGFELLLTFVYDTGYNLEEYQKVITNADYLVVCVNLDCAYPNIFNDILTGKQSKTSMINSIIDVCHNMYSFCRNCSKAHILWIGFEDYFTYFHHIVGNAYRYSSIIDCINIELMEKFENNDVLIDLKRIIADVGICNAYNTKHKYRWDFPYTNLLINRLVEEIYKQYLINNFKSKKCLVLDCDNVLWGGVISEDGIEKVVLDSTGPGKRYKDFQRFLLFMYAHGVILTVCSKNDEVDVYKMFTTHNEMLLKEEHIMSFQANWNNKADGIVKIAQELNIGLESIVFIDDSYFEVESIRAMLPQVTSILFDATKIYTDLSCFNLNSKINKQIICSRNNNYKTNKERQLLKERSKSYRDYLDSLEMTINIHSSEPMEYERIAELTQRANKCTNGVRYTFDAIKRNLEKPSYCLYSIVVSDKFSDLGLVGILGIDGNKLDIFVLSCRALGRGIEKVMIDKVKSHLVSDYNFITTGKNESIQKLLEEEIKNVKKVD